MNLLTPNPLGDSLTADEINERCDHCNNKRELSDYFCPTSDPDKKNPYRLCGECLEIWKESEKEMTGIDINLPELMQSKNLTLEEAIAYSVETITISRKELDHFEECERLLSRIYTEGVSLELANEIEKILKQKYNP